MKKIVKLIFYILVGIFYRKDIRIVNYRMTEEGYPAYMDFPKADLITESTNDALNRLLKMKQVSFKDNVNRNRILFGKTIDYKSGLFVLKLRDTFLSDMWIGKEPELVYEVEYTKAYWGILRFIKKYLMDYSYTTEHE